MFFSMSVNCNSKIVFLICFNFVSIFEFNCFDSLMDISRQYLSGVAKRKIKLEKDEENK